MDSSIGSAATVATRQALPLCAIADAAELVLVNGDESVVSTAGSAFVDVLFCLVVDVGWVVFAVSVVSGDEAATGRVDDDEASKEEVGDVGDGVEGEDVKIAEDVEGGEDVEIDFDEVDVEEADDEDDVVLAAVVCVFCVVVDADVVGVVVTTVVVVAAPPPPKIDETMLLATERAELILDAGTSRSSLAHCESTTSRNCLSMALMASSTLTLLPSKQSSATHSTTLPRKLVEDEAEQMQRALVVLQPLLATQTPRQPVNAAEAMGSSRRELAKAVSRHVFCRVIVVDVRILMC
ncbi:hypothetical protein F503_01965 [Ophiostoma piceae UAMH 11346]|uniref:Uncharacterized protein n=1 Tax=Ophiostoma piceae (strain UAMH 11346) TaxID=1262450 RepID=S3BS54_OPHP1|nr:hypothetical protein F503_01965 [Ophiostoma piceae UAMH 11346]